MKTSYLKSSDRRNSSVDVLYNSEHSLRIDDIWNVTFFLLWGISIWNFGKMLVLLMTMIFCVLRCSPAIFRRWTLHLSDHVVRQHRTAKSFVVGSRTAMDKLLRDACRAFPNSRGSGEAFPIFGDFLFVEWTCLALLQLLQTKLQSATCGFGLNSLFSAPPSPSSALKLYFNGFDNGNGQGRQSLNGCTIEQLNSSSLSH